MNHPFFIHHAWLVILTMSAGYDLVLTARAIHMMRANPRSASGYRLLLLGIIISNSLPWVVMGVGMELGGITNVFSYLRAPHGNPVILTWWISVFTIWFTVLFWLLFLRGAEFIAAHPGLLFSSKMSPNSIRIVIGLPILLLTGIILAIYFAGPRG